MYKSVDRPITVDFSRQQSAECQSPFKHTNLYLVLLI